MIFPQNAFQFPLFPEHQIRPTIRVLPSLAVIGCAVALPIENSTLSKT
jgi:hypothetical protein